MIKFTRYLQLYTLHHIEQTPYAQREVLHIQLSVLRYTLQQLPDMLDEQWQNEPQLAIAQTRDILMPRIAGLLDDDTIRQRVLKPTDWQPYHVLRQQHAVPQLPKMAAQETHLVSTFDRRLHQAERILRLTQTAVDVANAGLVLWKNWRALRDERRLVIDALHNTIRGHETALSQGSKVDFVRGYLDSHHDDPVYPTVFNEEKTD